MLAIKLHNVTSHKTVRGLVKINFRKEKVRLGTGFVWCSDGLL